MVSIVLVGYGRQGSDRTGEVWCVMAGKEAIGMAGRALAR